jgi:hypothetical protein
MQKIKRAQKKKRRRRAVPAGTEEGTRLFPGLSSREPFIPDFVQQKWRQTHDTVFYDAAQLCIMAWSCQGKLFGGHKTPRLIREAIDLIETHNVDVLWLNDA